MKNYQRWLVISLSLLTLVLVSVVKPALAVSYPLPAVGSTVVGENYIVRAQLNDTLGSIGIKHGVGYYEMLEANPHLKDNFLFIDERVTVPSRFILPAVAPQGIVINLDELRLYYYPPGKNEVVTFPVGIGREGWSTPVGKMSIIQKKTDPTWYVPESIRAWRAEQGVILPKTVPPGPANPLGRHMMRLSQPSYLLHGTNDPSGVGRRASSGCIRMYPTDIESLYNLVDVKTPVTIISQPYKAGWQGDKLYVESHLPLQENKALYADQLSALKQVIATATKDKMAYINWQVAEAVVKEEIGVPMLIGGTNTALEKEAAIDFTDRFMALKGYQRLPPPFVEFNPQTSLFGANTI